MISFTLNDYENGQDQRERTIPLRGFSLSIAETQFYSDGAQYLDPMHQNASVQF